MVALGAASPAQAGVTGFKRENPKTDLFKVIRFHHIDWWCADATSAQKRFSWGLGMQLVAKSDLSTGNTAFASYVLRSHDLVFALTAPYSTKVDPTKDSKVPVKWYSREAALKFQETHGLGVRAVGVLVEDAAEAYRLATSNGAHGCLQPTTLHCESSGQDQTVAEVELYGDVRLRFVSGSFQGPFLAGYSPVTDSVPHCYGLRRLDHAVGNVPNMAATLAYIKRMTGFHEFAEFTAEDVGTVDSGLNSMVLASNNEMVLLPVNEPTFGTRRKSQIQTYLEQNLGPGLQHLALKTDDIFATLREMRRRSDAGGFDFMPPASDGYYEKLPAKIGDALTPQQYAEARELGILVDRDDQGVLLQIFTTPLSDRPTVFLEVIQRIGCMHEASAQTNGAAAAESAASNGVDLVTVSSSASAADGEAGGKLMEQAGGCGGFGKGNFSELFKSIEDYERRLDIN